MSKFKILSNRRSFKTFHMCCAFLFGVVISQLFTSTFNSFEKSENVDSKNYFLVILVLTGPGNVERRNTMRETWLSLRPKDFNESLYHIERGNETIALQKRNLENFQAWLPSSRRKLPKLLNFRIKTLFAVGIEGLEVNLRRKIYNEREVFNDLLILDDLVDSYENLTLKLVKSMRKITEIVPNFKYLLKSDDDTYVKLDYLMVDLIEYDKVS